MKDAIIHMRRHEDRVRMESQGNEAARHWLMGLSTRGEDDLAFGVLNVHRAAQQAYSQIRTDVLSHQQRDFADDNALGRTVFEHSFIGLVASIVENYERYVVQRTQDALNKLAVAP